MCPFLYGCTLHSRFKVHSLSFASQVVQEVECNCVLNVTVTPKNTENIKYITFKKETIYRIYVKQWLQARVCEEVRMLNNNKISLCRKM